MADLDAQYLNVLRKIYARLRGTEVNWVVTGSTGFALQGLPVEPNDIDVQTDEKGAYEIEKLFSECVAKKVSFSLAEKIRSHFGALQIDGIKVEIMGDIQKRNDDGSWDDPVDLNRNKLFVEIEGMTIPVLSLEYEYQAYIKLGRVEKANMLKEWLENDPRFLERIERARKSLRRGKGVRLEDVNLL